MQNEYILLVIAGAAVLTIVFDFLTFAATLSENKPLRRFMTMCHSMSALLIVAIVILRWLEKI